MVLAALMCHILRAWLMENVPNSTPKKSCDNTTILKNVFAQYARPDNGLVVNKSGIDVDNRFIVPHNIDLLVKFQAHINVERVNHDGMHKYLFKYVTKGFNCVRMGIQREPTSENHANGKINEINNFLECCCVTPNDGAWRLLQYGIQYTDPSIEHLLVHLEEVLDNPNNVRTKLTSWFEKNINDPSARNYACIEFLGHFTWHADGKSWSTRRVKYNKISRIAHVNPTQGETYYLRMLLQIVKGAKIIL
jgi:hypothetical protein